GGWGGDLGELADLDTAAQLQVGAALGDRRGRLQVLGPDHRIADQLRAARAAVAERGPGRDQLAQVGEMLAHTVEPGRPGRLGLRRRGVAGRVAVDEHEIWHRSAPLLRGGAAPALTGTDTGGWPEWAASGGLRGAQGRAPAGWAWTSSRLSIL